MRLFIAINFNNKIKNLFFKTAEKLKNYSVKGNFTRRENFHLTVVFIGETTEIDAIKAAMDKLSADKFRLAFKGIGLFRRKNSEIYWVGVELNDSLNAIYRRLTAYLTEAGFMLEERKFNPHLTLGRQVITKKDFDVMTFSESIKSITVPVNKISLMRSERINGVLTYTEIYIKKLE
jgi:2'-5' RNA ligase